MFSEQVKQLRKIYNKLVKIPNLNEILIQHNGTVEYETEQGTCTAISLKSCPEIAIIDCEMSPNTLLKTHKHTEGYELLIVYKSIGNSDNSGLTVHYLDGRKDSVAVNDHIVINKEVAHIASCENGLKIIGITIPKDAGYP
jgi:hypothetical protein